MISSSEIDQYRRDGYTIVRGAVPPELIERLRIAAANFVEMSRTVSESDGLFDLEPGHCPEEPRLRRVKTPHLHDDAFGELSRCSPILDAVEQLIGADIRFQGAKLNMKTAGHGSPVEWHQDFAFYPHTNDDLLAVGVAIDDATVENGCLLVVPGSHSGPIYDHHDPSGNFVGAVDPELAELADAKPIELQAGDISLHHVRTLHASAPNLSSKPRRLVLYSYSAADALPLAKVVPGGTDPGEDNIVRGRATGRVRCSSLVATLPNLPANPNSIFSLQEAASRSRFDAEPRAAAGGVPAPLGAGRGAGERS